MTMRQSFSGMSASVSIAPAKLRDVARTKIWDSLIERVEYDSEVLSLALCSVQELSRVIEVSGIDAEKELAKAKIVLAKR